MIWRYAWQLAHYRPLAFWIGFAAWVSYLVLPLGAGLAIRAFFDELTGQAPAQTGVPTLLALVLAVEGGRVLMTILCIWFWAIFWQACEALLRINLLRWLLTGPGTRMLPGSAGESISRFRDDVEEILEFIDSWLDVTGHFLFAAIGLAIMIQINALIAIVVCVPLVLIVFVTHQLGGRIRSYRSAARAATGQVTGFIAESFGSVQTIKVAGAEERFLDRFRALGDTRRTTALRDTLLTNLIDSFNLNTANLALGLVLLLAAQAFQRGTFTVGDFALFATYITSIAAMPRWIGHMLTRQRQTAVSFERMHVLLQTTPVAALVEHVPLAYERVVPAATSAILPQDAAPELLRVEGLTYVHPSSRRGIHDIAFQIAPGERVIITGQIGSGKTTLLRALLGLLPADTGQIWWRGAPVDDPAMVLVPPQAAYTPQVPRLFSESLRENIMLSQRDDERLHVAISRAVLERDIALLPGGLATMIGPRGVRLSGGQIQRTAAARMFAQQPELLVFDDLSSALDVETEAILWERLHQQRGASVLAVSHRQAALRQADRILLLEEGRIIADGSLDLLLNTSPAMRAIWQQV